MDAFWQVSLKTKVIIEDKAVSMVESIAVVSLDHRVCECLRMRTAVPTDVGGRAVDDYLPYQEQNGREDSGLANLHRSGDSAVWLFRHRQSHSCCQLWLAQ